MKTLKALIPHIGIFGRRNVGKSSLLNAILGYDLAIVSPIPGTTTDIVEKTIELPALGPVVFTDTAGLDDTGDLGALRTQKTLTALDGVHAAMLVSDGQWNEYEEQLHALLTDKKIPFLIIWNKSDLISPDNSPAKNPHGQEIPGIKISALNKTGLAVLIPELARLLPESALSPPPLLRDLLTPGKTCMLIAPIDSSAPKGRLILPQVQALRDALDGHALSMVVQPQEIAQALATLCETPELAVCDSQAVRECVSAIPASIPLTTFSILMARLKGDLNTLAAGAAAINALQDNDKVCICESCAHHAQDDDIGRVKIPKMLRKFTGKNIIIEFAQGKDFPADLSQYKLLIHCGGCMINRPAMLARLSEAALKKVPITNYGVAISLMQNVLTRSLQIFPQALAAYQAACDKLKG